MSSPSPSPSAFPSPIPTKGMGMPGAIVGGVNGALAPGAPNNCQGAMLLVMIEALMVRFLIGVMIYYLIIAGLYGLRAPPMIAQVLLAGGIIYLIYIIAQMYKLGGVTSKPPVQAIGFLSILVIINAVLIYAFSLPRCKPSKRSSRK